ncbi:porin [Fodinibius sp. N2]|uniref:porin n=1 Tax=Fodinibius alkaliphilus TaxID=3140241 RepID=UPI00315AF5F2
MIYTRKLKTAVCLLAALFCVSTGAFAQQSTDFEQQVENLQEHLKNDYFSFGILLQGQADFHAERNAGNGFHASKGRFKMGGTFDGKFGYKLQATMLKSPSVLDANAYYKPSSQVELKAGLFKSPFSHEYLTGAGSVLFAGRSTVVNQLGPKRQLGLQLDTYTSEKTFRFTGGVFNGNGYNGNSNDDNKFLYIGRVESYLGNGDNQTKLGVSVANETKDVPGSGNLSTGYVGQQTLLTTYASTTQGKLLLDGEFINAWRNPDIGPDSNPYGYYVTAGYFVTDSSRLLARWDAFEGDNLAQDTEQILVGFNHSPNQFTKLKLTYSFPTNDGFEQSNFFAILQVGF